LKISGGPLTGTMMTKWSSQITIVEDQNAG
jgi:hypothetical protein